MKPTKRTRAVKKPRKMPPKRAVRGRSSRMGVGTTETPLAKLMKLKYLINDTAKDENGFSKDMGSDKSWVIEEISNLRGGGWLTAVKMKVANEMWSKYGG